LTWEIYTSEVTKDKHKSNYKKQKRIERKKGPAMPFEFGKPMLGDRALEEAGICARTLHKWYLTMCSKGRSKDQLSMTFTDDALVRTGDGPNNNALNVKDLFDLFNFRPMDIALVKFYEL
jgi:hypothetical protein